jgi:hypothetical protein
MSVEATFTEEHALEAAEARGADRRQQPTPRFSRYTFYGGRRKSVRRSEEREGSYVDRYRALVVMVVIWVALMNIGDSFFTLLHLQSGGIELNPVAAALLKSGRFGFVFFKSLMICAALIVLVLHKNFWMARLGLWASAAGYTLLNLYHISLF